MRDLTIVLDYPDAARQWHSWAQAETTVDFRHDTRAAQRCTEAFAAAELKTFLEKADPHLHVSVAQKHPEKEPFIALVTRPEDTGGGFELRPQKQGILVLGDGRGGLLNGAYELLRRQGWRWLEPGIYGESPPENPTLEFLNTRCRCIPSFRYRMIDQYRESDDSAELLIWMARQRINVVHRKPATGKLADKLGMLSRKGGHLLQKLMNPNNYMPDGRTIFDAHPEWYGLPEDGQRKRDTATRVQLCLSQPELLDYLARQVLSLLQGDMRDIDIIDLWGFDTWGQNCHCTDCRDKGNGADQNLFLLSYLRDYLNRHLHRPVMMNTISYEGSVTMEPPTKPVPSNLVEAGDFVIFYPIRRCYHHLLADRSCQLNQPYRDSLDGWSRQAPEMPLWSGEYYNVSKYEDLPLVFSALVPAEMRAYHAHGCKGATYMHNISPNWGVRALTQLQHTQYAWQVDTDDHAFLHEYFQRKYGNHARELRRVYERIEKAMADISSWRNWSVGALDILMTWEGDRPEREFTLNHFPTAQSVISTLALSVQELEQALHSLRQCLRREQDENWRALPAIRDIPPLLTPLDLEKIRYYDKVEYRLNEDIRGLIYGLDTMRLLLAFVRYHQALYGGHDGNQQWQDIEMLAARMSDYYVPITYDNPGPGCTCKDALTRTQLRMLITRCRGARIRNSEGKS